MTEKRFIEPYEECRVIKNIHTNEIATYCDTEDGLMFLKWLNNLSDENEQLKIRLNEEKEKALKFCRNIDTLTIENEQLKQQLKEYTDVFDCGTCKYHNYDWFDDGDEFEVCDKGNGEQQMDNHSCKDWEEL